MMKKINNIYNHISRTENILKIYNSQVKINTKNKRKIERFEDYLVENIVLIKTILEEKKYVSQNYNIFMVKEPKARIIMSQTIQDKVINHIVSKYFLLNIFERTLVDSNVATRKNKGTHYGIKLTKEYLREIHRNYSNIYILKCDIKKYFYTIDHKVLKSKITKKLKDKDALGIIYEIIDSTNKVYINNSLNNIKKNEIERIKTLNITEKEKQKKIEEVEKIPLYKSNKGIPIGNMSSQVFALIYLNDLDHYIKEELKIKYYVRYMDDFILIHHDKKYLNYCLNIIRKKIEEEYKLVLNEKTQIINIKNGLDFLGFRFYIKNNKLILKVRNQTKRRFKKRINKLNKLYSNEEINKKDITQTIASYKGHLKYGNTQSLTDNTLKEINNKMLEEIKELVNNLTEVDTSK